MRVQTLAVADFRNYVLQELSFHDGINLFYGDNAQGKTNLLEALYLCMTNKSYRGSKDRDMIRFGAEEAHLRLEAVKNEVPYRIDMHLKKNRKKGIAINSSPIRTAGELIGLLNVVFFSPEDLSVIKNGPAERRRFMDMELCQLDKVYLHYLNDYNKCLLQRNALLKDFENRKKNEDLLTVWDRQLSEQGKKVIQIRDRFVRDIAPAARGIHERLTGGKESLELFFEPNVRPEQFDEMLAFNRDREWRQGTTLFGPHRDDIRFVVSKAGEKGTDIRQFGSQGQQRTAALSLKLAEIEIVREKVKDVPVLLLDDVLSELDKSRQNFLLESIHDIQTFITCTGLDDFIKSNFRLDRVFQVENGCARQIDSISR